MAFFIWQLSFYGRIKTAQAMSEMKPLYIQSHGLVSNLLHPPSTPILNVPTWVFAKAVEYLCFYSFLASSRRHSRTLPSYSSRIPQRCSSVFSRTLFLLLSLNRVQAFGRDRSWTEFVTRSSSDVTRFSKYSTFIILVCFWYRSQCSSLKSSRQQQQAQSCSCSTHENL